MAYPYVQDVASSWPKSTDAVGRRPETQSIQQADHAPVAQSVAALIGRA